MSMPNDASDADVVRGEARHVDECPRLAEPLLLLALTCGAEADLANLVRGPISEEYLQVAARLGGVSLDDMSPDGLRRLEIPEAYLKHLRSYSEWTQRLEAKLDAGARDLARLRVLVDSGLCDLVAVASRLGVSEREVECLVVLRRPSTVCEAELATRMRMEAYSILADGDATERTTRHEMS